MSEEKEPPVVLWRDKKDGKNHLPEKERPSDRLLDVSLLQAESNRRQNHQWQDQSEGMGSEAVSEGENRSAGSEMAAP